MYVFPPKLQDLTSWPPVSGVSNAREMWEVSAPPDHSLYWSLAVSFIIASSENSNWMERLLGTQEEVKEMMQKKNIPFQRLDPKGIKKQVMNFNPFKNQHSFYHQKNLQTVFRLFKLRLNRAVGEMRRGSRDPGEDLKLKAATKILKCCIRVYETDPVGNKAPPTNYAPVADRVVLCLFKHTGVAKMYAVKPPPGQGDDHKVIDVYGFGMNLHHVVPLRRDALGHILKRTDSSQEAIQGIQKDFTPGGNFLVSLLGEHWKRDSVRSIYASPYIAWKLAAAGFETDPCTPDANGMSAFYRCLGLDSTHLLHVLYDYASNSFEHSDNSTRNPDPEVLRALTRIGLALESDRSRSNDFSMPGDETAKALKTQGEILSFNEYQRRVVQRISDQQQGGLSPPSVSQLDAEGSTARRKHIILSLLNLYPSHFYYSDLSQGGDSTPENKYGKFENFIQHSEYYENLDNYTCLLFFDNFLHLDLPAHLMNSAVQSLFQTVFGYNLFPKCLHGVHCNRHGLSTDDCALRVIPFIFRSEFLESAKAVLRELESPSGVKTNKSAKQGQQKEDKPKSVLMQVTSGLKDLPEIKDEFLIGRLRNYLDIATTVAVSENDIKGVLVVERALQVIGETLNTTESSSVIGHLLCSCLGNVVKHFFDIRHHILSHYKPRMMGGKLILETKIVRFRNIQDVIEKVYSLVKPVIVSQSLRIMDYMIEKGLKGSEDIHPTLVQNMQRERNGKSRLLTEKYVRNKSRYKCLANNLLNYIEGQATDDKCLKGRKIGQISALKFLFSFLASQCDETNRKEILLLLQDLDNLNKEFENKANGAQNISIEISAPERQKIARIVSNLRRITDAIFHDVKDEPRKEIDESVVETFFADARNFRRFTDEDMTAVKEKISECMRLSREAKATLRDMLSDGGQFSEVRAHQLLESIFASRKDKASIADNICSNREKALNTLNSVKKDEQEVFKTTSRDDDLDCLLRFTSDESVEGVHLLLRMDFPDDLRRKVVQFLNRKVEFLLDRIGHLKSILIEEDEEILSLWNWGKSEAIKTHTRFLMCQRYRREGEVRACLEMLLFDCMNILAKRKSLSHLWLKANDLFSGTSLRDVLSHGSTLLETVGRCLDEDDLPSHLVDKMLELIEDADPLRALSELWEKARTTDLKQFEATLEADHPSLRDVQKWMRKRNQDKGGWRDYLSLLPLK